MLININGHFVADHEANVSISDGSVLFGETLFETMKAYGTTIMLQKEHLDRLEQSAKALNFPCNRAAIETALQQVCTKITCPCSRLRLTISRGEFHGLEYPDDKEAWFCITATPYQETKDGRWPTPVTCVTAPNHRVNPTSHLPQMKRGNYADCLYARHYASENKADEAIFVDHNGHVLEGATTNLFIRKNRTLLTPPCGNLVLNGIVRQKLLQLIPLLDMQVVEQDITLQELLDADEAFITNSLIGVRPIASLDGTLLAGAETWQMLLILLKQSLPKVD